MGQSLLWGWDATNLRWVKLAADANGVLRVFDQGAQGLCYYGVVTAIPGANQFTVPTLAGQGAGKFAGATNPYNAFVYRDAGGASAAPQGEVQPITAYVTGTGVFTTAAFTAPVGIGDEILILHPSIALVLGIPAGFAVPAINSPVNALERDVIGNKNDTAAGSSLISLQSIPAADSPNNLNLRDVVGNKTDTNAGDSIISRLKPPIPDTAGNLHMTQSIGHKNDKPIFYAEMASNNSMMAFVKGLIGSSGLVYYGKVWNIPGANQFQISAFVGLGAGKFDGATNPYQAFVFRDGGGAAAAPQGEMLPITVYDSPSGTFTTAAFTAAIAVDDEILLLHPSIAGVITLLGRLTAARAGYLDKLNTDLPRAVLFKDQPCDPSTIIPTLAFSNVAADKDFPNVVLPAAGTFLPAGAVIQSVYLVFKWRKQYNSSGAANAINAAAKTIRIKKAADGWAASLVAVTMANGDWETVAGPAPAGVEGGDMMIGSVDIKGKVDAFGTTYNIRSDQTTNADGITVTAASLTLYGVTTILRVYYTLE